MVQVIEDAGEVLNCQGCVPKVSILADSILESRARSLCVPMTDGGCDEDMRILRLARKALMSRLKAPSRWLAVTSMPLTSFVRCSCLD